MELLELNNTLENSVDLDIANKQKSFLETSIGRMVDSAVDLGIRALLPNLIEDQVKQLEYLHLQGQRQF